MTSNRSSARNQSLGVGGSPGVSIAELVRPLVSGDGSLLRNLLLYLLIPGLLSLSLISMYFSDVVWMQRIIIPHLPDTYPDSIREFGLVENLQNFYLLAMIGLSAYAARTRPVRWQRRALALSLVIPIFIFLEEIDYGLHHYELLMGISHPDAANLRNLHTINRSVDTMKIIADAGIFLAFVGAPFLLAKSKHPVVRYLLPSRWFSLTVVAMVLLSELAHGLEQAGLGPGTMDRNLSEFRELTVYYILLIYVHQLAFKPEGSRGPHGLTPHTPR